MDDVRRDQSSPRKPSIDVREAPGLLIPCVISLHQGSPFKSKLGALHGRAFEKAAETLRQFSRIWLDDNPSLGSGEFREVAGGRDQHGKATGQCFEDRHAET